ncbi:DUF6491 family protein [Glacieibacterium frigidum]|uniref:Uncharacterized protein n=1 Tax=Glacieibacterium frigidum TaxID=2593303 RepID=A0A552UF31_9SPHN|nr:DUF6491 family protein [Glacieibacterium frigidum]TRW16837.1 hypothetical protein FMM06_01110 [Glacieibacterium frigidum]
MRTALLALALFAAPALAKDPPRDRGASIPFANTPAGILDWRVADDRTVYLQGTRKRWYRADLFGVCNDLPYAQSLGFQTNLNGSFDAFSAIIAGGQRCPLKSLTALPGEPPPIPKRR